MSCCPPQTPNDSTFIARIFDSSNTALLPTRVNIPGGAALLGTDFPINRLDGEDPVRKIFVDPFQMSVGAITNAEFAAFVRDTDYVTEAEHYGWSFVFSSQVPDDVSDTQAVPSAPWWRRVEGACWQRVCGPACTLASEQIDHPVVHLSWNDANAYCSWVGGRLPSESEWEHAARGKLGDVQFPWGNTEPNDTNHFPCNIWQGRFPDHNAANDGYPTTAPVVSFDANGFGLYNMVGNVWEWTQDTFSQPRRRTNEQIKLCKGGSFLCHKSYCFRYRIAARIGNTSDSSTTHTGFRVVWS